MFTATARRIAAAVTTVLAPPAPTYGTDEDELEQLLADGQLESVGGIEYAHCPAHQTVTAHALHTDGSQSCIDCSHTLNGAS